MQLIEEHLWPGLALEYRARESAAFRRLYAGDFDGARTLMEEAFQVLLQSQPEGRRYHKGEALHNLGLIYLTAGDLEAAARETLAAFVEDSASLAELQPFDYEEFARPAARNLVFVLGVGGPALAEFATKVRARVSLGTHIANPRDMVASPDGAAVLASRQATATTRLVEHLRTGIARAVFVGGPYGENGIWIDSHLRPMQEEVNGLGYEGVIVGDLEAPSDWRSDHKSISMLYLCQFTVIDATIAAGQIAEVHALTDRHLSPDRTLVIWDSDVSDSPMISGGMNIEKLTEYGINPIPYHGIDDARRVIREWLPGAAASPGRAIPRR